MPKGRGFSEALVKGAKETPRGFFAPLIAIWRLLIAATEAQIAKTATEKAKRA